MFVVCTVCRIGESNPDVISDAQAAVVVIGRIDAAGCELLVAMVKSTRLDVKTFLGWSLLGGWKLVEVVPCCCCWKLRDAELPL